jgi:UDP-N-acetylmuramate--alanine ligase
MLLNPNGYVFANLDDLGVRRAIQSIPMNRKIHGITNDSHKQSEFAIFYSIQENELIFQKNGKEYVLSTPYAGDHYLTNGLLAILATEKAGVPIETSLKILQKYSGVKRRLEFLGEFHKIKVYDDYGHHPTEIESVLNSMNKMKKNRESLCVVFQPHRYTRTKELYLDFAKILSKIDKLFLLPIYPAGEDPIPGVSSDLIYKNLTNKQKTWFLTGSIQKDVLVLKKEIEPGDLLVTIGAGSVRSWGESFLSNPVFFHLPINGSSGNP